MIRFDRSIGFRLLSISIILLVIPVLVDSFIFLAEGLQSASRKARMTLTSDLIDRASPLDQEYRQNKEIFELLSYFMDLENAFPSEPTESFNALLKRIRIVNDYKNILLVKYTDEKKFVVLGDSLSERVGEDITYVIGALDPFNALAQQKGIITTLVSDPASQVPLLLTLKPIFSKDGKKEGILMAVDNFLADLDFLLRPSEGLYRVDYALLLPSTVIFAATDPKLLYQYFNILNPEESEKLYSLLPKAKNRLPQSALSSTVSPKDGFREFSWGGEKYIATSYRLAGSDVSLMAYASKKAITRVPIQEFIVTYGTYFLIFLIGFLIASYWTHRLALPLAQLGEVMKKMVNGDLNIRYQDDRYGFEINKLGQIFNEMITHLISERKLVEEERLKKELVEKELKVGEMVQLQLLPQSIPSFPQVEIAQGFDAAYDVGGDFFDVFIKPDGKLVLTIADASGKGTQACLYSLVLKNSLKVMTENEKNLFEAMRRADNLFCEDTGDTGMFVTVFMAQYDPATQMLEYYSCGHNPVMIYKAKDNQVGYLHADGIAMGFMPRDKAGDPVGIKMESQDMIVLYSDGVTESHNPDNQLFGEERLKRFILLEAATPLPQFAARLMEELKAFSRGRAQHDDITFMIMRVK